MESLEGNSRHKVPMDDDNNNNNNATTMTTPAATAPPSTSRPRIPVLLLKTRSTPTDGYEAYFRTHPPFHPVFIPVLAHAPNAPALAHLASLLRTGAFSPAPTPQYGGLIFTSQRAVEAFAHILSSLPSLPLASLSIPLYTVGPATARALTALRDPFLPLCSVQGAATGSGHALALYILKHYPRLPNSSAQRPPLLFLVGEQRRDVIPRTLQSALLPLAEQIPVHEVVVYETRVQGSFAEDFRAELGRATVEEGPVWVVVFSPAGCEGLLRELGWLDEGTGRAKRLEGGDGMGRRVYVACIGPTTREYLAGEWGVEVDVCAEEPSPEGVGREIERFMRQKGIW